MQTLIATSVRPLTARVCVAVLVTSALVGCAAPSSTEAGTATGDQDLQQCVEPGEGGSPGAAPCGDKLGAYGLSMLTPTPEGLYALASRRTVVSIPRDRTAPETLATVDNALGMTVDDTHLYVLNQGMGSSYEILAIDRQTGTVRTLATSPHSAGFAYSDEPGPMAISKGTLYWSECGGGSTHSALGSIRSLDLAAPAARPRTLATRVNCTESIAVDETHVYWSDKDSIERVALAGGTRQRFASTTVDPLHPSGPRALAVGAGFVYWSDRIQGNIYRAPTSNGSAPTKVANAWPARITLAGGYVYFTGGIGVSRAAVDGSTRLESVVSGNTVSDVALSGPDLYWSGYRGVFRRKLANSPVE